MKQKTTFSSNTFTMRNLAALLMGATRALPVLIASITLITMTAGAETSAAGAQPLETSGDCRELLKECFAYKDDVRAHCFYSTAKHAYCQASPLGKLSLKRWIFSGRPGELRDAAALLGPDVVDQSCVANFDSLLSGDLIKKEPSAEEVNSLLAHLDSCRRPAQIDLSRP